MSRGPVEERNVLLDEMRVLLLDPELPTDPKPPRADFEFHPPGEFET